MHIKALNLCSIMADFPLNNPELSAAPRAQISGVTWIYRHSKRANANMSISFQRARRYLLLHVTSHFRLKWFQFSANVMLSEDRKGPAALFQGSSIIHYNHNPSANPGNYWLQAASHVAGSGKHTHTHTESCSHTQMSCQESETHLHIRRSGTCSLTPPLFTEVLLNTLWNYKKFKWALQALAGT